jgi:hypothetical protein
MEYPLAVTVLTLRLGDTRAALNKSIHAANETREQLTKHNEAIASLSREESDLAAAIAALGGQV